MTVPTLGLAGGIAAAALAACWRIAVLSRWLRALEADSHARARRLASLLQATQDGVLITDRGGRIVDVNAQAEGMLGYARLELLGRDIDSVLAEDHRPRYARARPRMLEQGLSWSGGAGLELAALRADGSEIPVEVRLVAVESGGETMIAAALRDGRERRSATEVRRRLAAIVEHTDDAIFSVTPAGEISSWNGGAGRLYGYGARDALGMAVFALVPADRELDERDRLARVIAGGEVGRYETVHLRRDGGRIDVALTLSPVREQSDAVVAASVIARDITERKRFEGQLQYLADHDALTGLFNRRRFEEEVERELARARRAATGGGLLAIDLDDFKEVNDSYGHAAGDELIRRTAELLRTRLRATDLLARLGGDEFAALLPGTDAEAARRVAGEVLQSLRSETTPALPGGRQLTASIGIVGFRAGIDVTAAELMAEADIAMYDAKEAGRDRIAVYRGRPGERVRIRTTWPQRIREALDDGRLLLMAQPIIALGGPAEPRYELLVRMVTESGELIAPGAFLHAAERHDLITQIDGWVLHSAVELLGRAQRAGHELKLGINQSATSVADPELPARVASELESAGAKGTGLWLEISETAAILNVDRARTLAARLASVGCELALDDFGAGFASFYYLKHLAFDYVKIDSEFIAQLRQNRTNELVVRAIVDITRGLGKLTIAECVNDLETVDLLRDLGVDYAQGYFLGEPRPLAEIDVLRAIAAPDRAATT